jgi:hypothetical protein
MFLKGLKEENYFEFFVLKIVVLSRATSCDVQRILQFKVTQFFILKGYAIHAMYTVWWYLQFNYFGESFGSGLMRCTLCVDFMLVNSAALNLLLLYVSPFSADFPRADRLLWAVPGRPRAAKRQHRDDESLAPKPQFTEN